MRRGKRGLSYMLRFFGRGDREDRERTQAAVGRTRGQWFRQVTGLFQRSQIDDGLWDELEELLISADVGVSTTMKLLDGMRERIRRSGITHPDEALEALKEEMIGMLTVEGSERAMDVEEPPLVILMVGVNGVGRRRGSPGLRGCTRTRGGRCCWARETRSGPPLSSSSRRGENGWKWT